MQTITLTESAVATLRFLIKGLRMPVTERRLPAFRELAAAGIMFPLSGFNSGPESSFLFTHHGWERREQWLTAVPLQSESS